MFSLAISAFGFSSVASTLLLPFDPFAGPTKVSLVNPAERSGLENGSVFCLRFVCLEEDGFENIPTRYEPMCLVLLSFFEDVSGQSEGMDGLCAICRPPKTSIR